MIFHRELRGFVCCECQPEDEAYFYAVRASDVKSRDSSGPLDTCPRCGGYLSFVQEGDWAAESMLYRGWVEKKKQETNTC